MTSTIKSYCRTCRRENNHYEQYKFTEPSKNEDDPSESNAYWLLRCCGCETISFRIDYTNEYYTKEEVGEVIQDYQTIIYPSVQEKRAEMSNADNLPDKIYNLYLEVLASLSVESFTLVVAGLRAIVEAVCAEFKIKGNELKDKISKLQEKGYIAQLEVDRLNAVRFSGNDSLHQMKVPREDQVIVMLEIIEHLLTSLFLMKIRAKEARLETVINEYNDFLRLLNLKLKSIDAGTELTLKKLLGLDARRLEKNFHKFENQLIDQIKNGNYTYLRMGEFKIIDGQKSESQLYIKI